MKVDAVMPVERLERKWAFSAARPIVVILLVSSALFFFRIGERSFRNPDEGRYAEIAREMVVSNDWIEPTLYGTDYLRKPILFYWLLAASFKVLGPSEFSARLVPALFGLLGVLAAYFFARRYFGEQKALVCSLLLATNLFYVGVSRYLLIDAVFSFFLCGVLYAAYLVLEEPRRRNLCLFYACLALAFLTKGVAGAVIPAFTLLIYLALARKLKGIVKFLSPTGICLFLALTLPWFVAISIHEPEFFNFFFLHEHLSRFVSAAFEHQEPWYFYLALLPLVFFPWSLFVPVVKTALTPATDASKEPRFYLRVLFCGLLLFYSLSRSKLATYLMPAIPLGSILIGDAVISWLKPNDSKKTRVSTYLAIGSAALFILSVCFVIFSPLFGLRFAGKIPVETRPFVLAGLVLVGMGSVCLIYCLATRRRKTLFLGTIFFLSLLSVLSSFIMEAMNARYTTKHFAEVLKPVLSGEEVFIYGQPGAFYDFAFYLNRPVKLVGLEGELEFNLADYNIEAETRDAVVMPDEWLRLAEHKKIYSLMRVSDYRRLAEPVRQRLHVMARDDRKVLLESVPQKP